MKYRCLACKTRFDLRPGTKDCVRCCQPVPRELIVEAATPSKARRSGEGSKFDALTKKERARRAKQQWRPGAAGTRQPAASSPRKRRTRDLAVLGKLRRVGDHLMLVTVDRSFRVKVMSDIQVSLLLERQLTWMVQDCGNGTAKVAPFDSVELRRLRVEQEVNDRALSRSGGAYSILHPRPPGQSKVERAKGREQVELIRHLALRQDDPAAWAELCSAWRLRPTRALVNQALLDIGLDKILQLLRLGAPGWPDGLVQWVETEFAKKRSRSSGNKVDFRSYRFNGMDPNSDFINS